VAVVSEADVPAPSSALVDDRGDGDRASWNRQV